MTQKELADCVGVSRSLISLVETGVTRPYPSLKKRIAKALSVSQDEIFGGESKEAS